MDDISKFWSYSREVKPDWAKPKPIMNKLLASALHCDCQDSRDIHARLHEIDHDRIGSKWEEVGKLLCAWSQGKPFGLAMWENWSLLNTKYIEYYKQKFDAEVAADLISGNPTQENEQNRITQSYWRHFITYPKGKRLTSANCGIQQRFSEFKSIAGYGCEGETI